jgi:creatinine amidohydrolase
MQWEDLTAPEFAKGVKKAQGVCILPVGVIEKHGNHLPLGTDLFIAQHFAQEAAKREPAIVFPPYYLSQIHEAKPQPGTIAVKNTLMMDLLFGVCDEISRNGLKKILICNGHGGNGYLLPYFCQLALEEQKDYTLYLTNAWSGTEDDPEILKICKDPYDGHGGENETSQIMSIRPELVKLDADNPKEGVPQKGIGELKNIYNGIWWYAQQPHHYRGQGKLGSVKKGNLIVEKGIQALVKTLKLVKKDKLAPKFTKEFFKKTKH